jgi:hypothetical protein
MLPQCDVCRHERCSMSVCRAQKMDWTDEPSEPSGRPFWRVPSQQEIRDGLGDIRDGRRGPA